MGDYVRPGTSYKIKADREQVKGDSDEDGQSEQVGSQITRSRFSKHDYSSRLGSLKDSQLEPIQDDEVRETSIYIYQGPEYEGERRSWRVGPDPNDRRCWLYSRFEGDHKAFRSTQNNCKSGYTWYEYSDKQWKKLEIFRVFGITDQEKSGTETDDPEAVANGTLLDEWKKENIPGFYEYRKANGGYYERNVVHRGHPNNNWYVPGEEPGFEPIIKPVLPPIVVTPPPSPPPSSSSSESSSSSSESSSSSPESSSSSSPSEESRPQTPDIYVDPRQQDSGETFGAVFLFQHPDRPGWIVGPNYNKGTGWLYTPESDFNKIGSSKWTEYNENKWKRIKSIKVKQFDSETVLLQGDLHSQGKQDNLFGVYKPTGDQCPENVWYHGPVHLNVDAGHPRVRNPPDFRSILVDTNWEHKGGQSVDGYYDELKRNKEYIQRNSRTEESALYLYRKSDDFWYVGPAGKDGWLKSNTTSKSLEDLKAHMTLTVVNQNRKN